ncbi:hypothetical protein HDU97_005172 [Phlyctochytrium planicorne]|nr:hypothetical protein HDU97_005172 [Phlyctochytrium planicorne]
MIRELDISGNAADNLYMGDLDAVLGMSPNLEVFRLENCFHISNILIQSLAHHCPNLLQLDLPGCPISDSFISALTKKCKHILRLDLSFTNVSIASIHPVISQSESLLELDLSECREADDLMSLDLSYKGYKRPLKSLNLRNTPVNDDLLRFAISQCPELEIIVLESCPSVTDDAVIKIVNTCFKLRSLDCSFCDRITDLSLNALTVRAAASNGGTLEELYLSACDLITPTAVHQMVQKNTKLELLVLDGCEKILGTYVQEFANDRSDELECSLEGEGLRALAVYNVVASLATPPASPGRLPHDTDGQLRVQVTYATHDDGSDPARRRRPNTSFAAAIIKNVQNPGEAAAAIAAAKEAAARENGTDSNASSPTGTGTPSGSPGLQRRSSRTLRHRRSLLGLSARGDADEEDAVENAKMERQEKIREKRRSRTSSVEQMSGKFSYTTPASPPSSTGGLYSSTGSYSSSPLTVEPSSAFPDDSSVFSPVSTSSATSSQPSKANIDEAAAKAAFVAALAAKGVKVAAPGEEPVTPAVPAQHSSPSKRTSTLSLKASEFVPTSGYDVDNSAPATAPIASSDPWDAKVPQRKMSVGTPMPPAAAAAGSWTPPMGITQSAVLAQPQATPIAAPVPVAAVAAPAPAVGPDGGVLLFSGRAARAASISKQNEAAAQAPVATETGYPTSSSPTPMDGADGSILIASGRRRTRTNSLVQNGDAPAVPLSVETNSSAAAAAATAATPGAPPAWINQPPISNPAKPPSPWGTDPTVWNNPAQLTSSSSTWSTANPQAGFVDPWAKPTGVLGPSNVSNSMDPWAAAPPSITSPQAAPPMHMVPPSPVTTNAPASAGWAQPPLAVGGTGMPTALQAQPAPTNGPVVGANWGPSVPPSATPTAAAAAASAKAPRPGVAGYPATASSRFGSVGMGSRTGSFGTISSPASGSPTTNGDAGAAAPATPGAAKEPFVFSSQKRGRMLLKLKIETKTGGHQTLAVHELDDPVQLATEFVTYWDMAAFKEPLVRLISVRKTNVLRSRGH